jgi:hypothetical protein
MVESDFIPNLKMHHSLNILEILWAILSACDDRTLGTLARTCRLFHDPALDILWTHQHSLITLLKIMPADLWEERKRIWGVPSTVLVCRTMIHYPLAKLTTCSIFEDPSLPLILPRSTNTRGE